jgi:hypothetical protein
MAGVAALSTPLFVYRWGKERVVGWGVIGISLSLLPLALISHWGAAEIGFIGAIAIAAMVVSAYTVFSQALYLRIGRRSCRSQSRWGWV